MALRDGARAFPPYFDGAGGEGVSCEFAESAVPGVVHEQHGGFFVAAAEETARETIGIALTRITPVLGIAEDFPDIVVARKHPSAELCVAVNRIALAKFCENRIGILAELGVEMSEANSGRNGGVVLLGSHRDPFEGAKGFDRGLHSSADCVCSSRRLGLRIRVCESCAP